MNQLEKTPMTLKKKITTRFDNHCYAKLSKTTQSFTSLKIHMGFSTQKAYVKKIGIFFQINFRDKNVTLIFLIFLKIIILFTQKSLP